MSVILISMFLNACLHLDSWTQQNLRFISNLFAYWVTPVCSSLGSLFLGLIIKENDSIRKQLEVRKMPKLEKKQIVSQSDIEQLIKLKALLDTNILSEEEFEAKKKQLLGI